MSAQMITTRELSDLKAKAEAATPGEWEDIHPNADDGDIRVQVYHAHKRTVLHDADSVAWKLKDYDARYIAAANPAAVLRLIDAFEKACGVIEKSVDKYFDIPIEDRLGPPSLKESETSLRARAFLASLRSEQE